MDEKAAWERFAQTGSVASYLAYCKVKQEADGEARSAKEERDADQHRWTGAGGTDRGGE